MLALIELTTCLRRRMFSIYSKGMLVGYSELEHGDPPMGVAHGVFVPADGYALIRVECGRNHSDQTALELSVKTSTGAAIACVVVAILDGSPGDGAGVAEVEVLGISYPMYGELFPGHVKAYDDQFN